MAGWFYPPPGQPQTLPALPAGTTAFGNAPPNPIGNGAQYAALVASWPQDNWPAQRAPIIASQFAKAWANPPQPQPFYGTRPLDAQIRGTWPELDWPVQRLTGGGVGALTANVVQPPPPLLTNPSLLASIVQSWPQDNWPAQRGAQIASLLAQAVSPPSLFPSPPRALQASLYAQWLPDDWRAQSECGIASGLAQIQLPPLYLPYSTVAQQMRLRSTWPEDAWPVQILPSSSGWYPLPVTAKPAPVRQLAGTWWAPDDWPAQHAARIASLFAVAPQAQPFINRVLLAAIRASWPNDDWLAQRAATIASLLVVPQLLAVPYSAASLFPITQWLPDTWPAQRGQTSPWLAPAAPPPKQYVSEWAAIYILVNAGFIPFVTYATDPVVPAEYVISQLPSATNVTGVPQVVTIVVSTGPAAPEGLTSVPPVIGLFAKDATDALQAAFLSVDRYLWQPSSSPEGTVINQSIPASQVVDPGTIVQLTLSSGTAKVAPTLTVPLVH
jgi:PASTA domain